MKSSLKAPFTCFLCFRKLFSNAVWFLVSPFGSAQLNRMCVKVEAERMRFDERKTIDRKNLMVNYLSVSPFFLARCNYFFNALLNFTSLLSIALLPHTIASQQFSGELYRTNRGIADRGN